MATHLDIIERALYSAQREEREHLYRRLIAEAKTRRPDSSALAPEHRQAFELGYAQAIEHVLQSIDDVFGKNDMPF